MRWWIKFESTSELFARWLSSALVGECGFLEASFRYLNGLPSDSFVNVVGIPRIRHHDTAWLDSSATGPDPETTFIYVPHYDPGGDKYGDQPDQQRRLLFLTWMITILIGDSVAKALPITSGTSRLAFLRSTLDSISHMPQMVRLQQEIYECKLSLSNYWQKFSYNRAAMTPEAKLKKSEAAVRRVVKGRIAQGLPSSKEREMQVNLLWKMKLPDLHWRSGLSHSDGDKKAWIAWDSGVGEGKAYASSLLATYPDQSEEDFLKKNAGRQRVRDRRERFATLTSKAPQLTESSLKSERISFGVSKARYGATDEEAIEKMPSEVLEGKHFTVSENREIIIKWTVDGAIHKFKPRVPVPAIDGYLFFRPDGISFHAASIGSGAPYLIKGGSKTVTWDKTAINAYPGAGTVAMKACWEKQTGLRWTPEEIVDEYFDDSGKRFLASDYPPLGRNPSSSKKKYQTPPRFWEGTYLIYRWCQDKRPVGGSFFMSPNIEELKDKLPDECANDIRAFLLDYLEEPEFDRYPHKSEWKGMLLKSASTSTIQILANFEFCRKLTPKDSKYRVQKKVLGKPFGGYWRYFGSKFLWEDGGREVPKGPADDSDSPKRKRQKKQ